MGSDFSRTASTRPKWPLAGARELRAAAAIDGPDLLVPSRDGRHLFRAQITRGRLRGTRRDLGQ